MRVLRNAVKIIAFILILILLLFVSIHILSRPHGVNWASETGMDLVHRFKNQYDICFAGTSVVISNVSNQELFDKYGITAVSVGEPEQPLFLTKSIIEEVLRYQKPKAIVLDSRGLFYDEKLIKKLITKKEEYIVHYALDTVYSFDIKKKALDHIRKRYKAIDDKEYYISLYHNHSNWKSLGRSNFTVSTAPSFINGNIMLTELYDIANAGAAPHLLITKENEKELIAIKEMCRGKGVDLILMTGYIDPLPSRQEQMQKIAKAVDLEYIDVNEVANEIGLEGKVLSDPVHFNVIGATIWSDYIGEVINRRYSIEKCGKEMAQFYQDQDDVFFEYKAFVAGKLWLITPKCFIT